MNIKSIATLLALLSGCLQGQTLNDFSSFYVSDRTYFEGTWAAGSFAPANTFSQGDGVYNITGGKNDIGSLVTYYFLNSDASDFAPISIGSNRFLSLTAMALPGTTAPSLTIRFSDNAGDTNFASASFDLTKLSTTSYTTLTTPIEIRDDKFLDFDWSAIQSYVVSGGITGGTDSFNISFDNLAAVSAIPEPSTYAAIFGALTLGGVCYRRYRRK
jgi:hypothetical protein